MSSLGFGFLCTLLTGDIKNVSDSKNSILGQVLPNCTGMARNPAKLG